MISAEDVGSSESQRPWPYLLGMVVGSIVLVGVFPISVLTVAAYPVSALAVLPLLLLVRKRVPGGVRAFTLGVLASILAAVLGLFVFFALIGTMMTAEARPESGLSGIASREIGYEAGPVRFLPDVAGARR